jgi:Fe2+ or Zn2+ uptake regulation protein
MKDALKLWNRDCLIENVASDPNSRIFEIASRILEYLEKSPHAEDTYRGILEWWLLQQMIEIDSMDVRQALRELVSEGFLIESERSDKQVLYHFNSEQTEAAKAFRRQRGGRNPSDRESGV